MCGIVGFNWDDKELAQKMKALINHRGPDQSGIYTDDSFTFGHVRLSILDLSEKGKQPMIDAEGFVLTYNGEIYNFKEIREELKKKGYQFFSETDTEVIIAAYREYGKACVSKFNGMFAFALYDPKKKIIFLARDRSGIKPLYYSHQKGKFVFSSELKALLLHSHISRAISRKAFYNYLTFRYTPCEDTLFGQIKKLLPGHIGIYDLAEKQFEIEKYFELNFTPNHFSVDQNAKILDDTFSSAVKERLISDVPLGAFLSGGLDSSYTVAHMKKFVDSPIKTFSVGFDHGQGYDERSYAKIVSEHLGTDHHEIVVEEQSFNLLPKIIWHLDEPIADFAAIPTYILSEFARKKVTVALTGEGADEILGGYRKYRYLKAYQKYFKLFPSSLRALFSSFFKNEAMGRRKKQFSSAHTFPDAYLALISYFTESEKKELIPNLQMPNQPDYYLIEKYFTKNLLDSLMKLDFETWLPDDILTKVDKMSMAHALECRVPFLDPKILDMVSTIPSSQKVRFLKEKYVLRKAMKPYLPKVILQRKKHGFNVPIHNWLENDLKPISQELLYSSSLLKQNTVSSEYLDKLFKNYKKSPIYYSRQLWLLLNFEIWTRLYCNKEKFQKPRTFDDLL